MGKHLNIKSFGMVFTQDELLSVTVKNLLMFRVMVRSCIESQ